MEYNQQLTDALLDISISPNLTGDPNGMRVLLEDKLDEANHHILSMDITGFREDITITRGELEYLFKIKRAYNLFMNTYEGYLDNQSITNNY